MKAALFLAFAILPAIPAAAQPAWQRHEAEARRFLVPCPQANARDRNICQSSQRTFIKTYISAMAGDFVSITALVWALSPPMDDYTARTMSPGIPANPSEACAWSYLLFKTTAQADAFKDAFVSHCDPLGQTGRNAAMVRVKEIARSIDMDSKPPANWQPHIDGLRDR